MYKNFDKIIDLLEIPLDQRRESDIQQLFQLTKDNQFFQKLTENTGSEELHRLCCGVMQVQQFKSNEKIIQCGDIGTTFFIILRGRADIFVPPVNRNQVQQEQKEEQELGNTEKNRIINILKTSFGQTLQHMFLTKIHEFLNRMHFVGQYGPGDSFGELSLLCNQPRAATIISKGVTAVAVIQKEDFNNILGSFAESQLKIKLSLLQQQPIFKNWTKAQLSKLSYYFNWKTFNRNQIVYKQNQPVDNIYIVKQGEFKLQRKIEVSKRKSSLENCLKSRFQKSPSKQIPVETIIKSSNQMFGQKEIVQNIPKRTESCICQITQSVVLYISKEEFKKRINSEEVMRGLRLKQSLDDLRDEKRMQKQALFYKIKYGRTSQVRQFPIQQVRIQNKRQSIGRLSYINPRSKTIFRSVDIQEPNVHKIFRVSTPDLLALTSPNKLRNLNGDTKEVKIQKQTYIHRRLPPPNFYLNLRSQSQNSSPRVSKNRSANY